jgi:valyl-tRNA synthetase
MKEISFPKRPNIREIEEKWQKRWEELELYRFDPNFEAKVYSIDVPPRYVSGPLHVGHAISYTHIDFIARYKRMRGFNVFNPFCVDANGLPIEVNVEKMGIVPENVGREKFVEECKKFGEKNIEKIKEQFKLLGHSFDPSIYYATDSPEYRRVTQITFIELYKKGLIYRGKYPITFCPRCKTAIADAEIEYKERETSIYTLKFYIKDAKDSYITIATTRPELLSVCQLIAVNPGDKRFTNIIGKKAITPLYQKEVKIVADSQVDPKFGTGIVMICTFGDKEDVEWGYKYKLEFIKAINEEGKLTEVSGNYKGMSINEARNRICEDLRKQGLLLKESSLTQRVGVCWRCATPVEFIVTTQWFLKMLQFKEKIIEIQSQIKWYPEYMRKRLINWIDSLRWDWCISRQRYFATPIPVWECGDCEYIVLANPEDCYVEPYKDAPPTEKCPKCKGKLYGSKEVFDTWFDSSITPLYNAGWRRDEKLFKKLYPMSLRPQAHDIIRTWAFYTIFRSYLLTNEPPFKEIAISGFILAPDGRPMHASWGNVVDPLEIIEKYGTDALRYFAANCGLGVDTPFNWEKTEHGVNFLIKLWNICRFSFPHISNFSITQEEYEYTITDRWLLSLLKKLIDSTTEAYENYEFHRAIREIETFVWHKLADNYLEIVKHRLYEPEIYKLKHKGAQRTIYLTLLSVLKLLSPILPHITEELYEILFKDKEKKKSIHQTLWPYLEFYDEEALKAGDRMLEILSALRKWKHKKGMSLGAFVKKVVVFTKIDKYIPLIKDELQGAMRIEEIQFKEGKLGVENE